MITNKLSKRLTTITQLVEDRRVVDVGCDHGKVVNYLITNNIVDFAICTDISLPSVKKADELLRYNNVSDTKYSIRCGDGLSTITKDDKIGTAIIAGMGGNEIIKILSESPLIIDTLILQPQRNVVEVKEYLLSNMFSIIYDKIVEEDGKFYTVIKASRTSISTQIDPLYLYFGHSNFYKIDNDFLNYVDYEEKKYRELHSKVSNSNRQKIDYMLNLIKIVKNKLGVNNE